MKFLVFAALIAVAASAAVPTVSTTWSLNELSEAITSSDTDPALLPYLEQALNQLMASLFAGENADSITVAIPAGLVPIVDDPAPSPAVDSTVSNPLVQIIININQDAPQVADAVVPVPAPVPESVSVVDASPEPVVIVPVPAPLPESVSVVDANPEPVVVIPIPNPIDVIAVSPAEINPIDLLQPLPVVNPAAAAGPFV